MKPILFFSLFAVSVCTSLADGWPMYRADSERSGYTSEEFPKSLTLQWMYKSNHDPHPAWQARDTRMFFDYAYRTVIADGQVYFGSSADGKIYALDAKTGQEQWTFFTDAPVRFAPLVFKNQVFAVSDGGYLYCLSAQDGTCLWKMQGGPEKEMLLGNDRMVSRWPVRGAPVLKDGVLYFAAGIWPSEGIFIYALDPDTKKVLWKNDSAGYIEMPQPHPTAFARSGVSAQGYLAATKDQLFVPTGRAVPAAFDRTNGQFQYFHLQANRGSGGSFVSATESYVFNNGILFNSQSGLPDIKTDQPTIVFLPNGVAQSTNDKVSVYSWIETEKTDRKGNKEKTKELKQEWSVNTPHAGVSLIAAGNTLISGGKNGVCAIDMDSQKVFWSQEVDGTPYDLACADQRLYVSTDKGNIYCFGADKQDKPITIEPSTDTNPYGENEIYTEAAKEIIQKTNITEGYCLDLGCGDGALAYELAKWTDLHIYAVDDNIENVKKAREKLDAAGLYGTRVTVHHADISETLYPDYFADLIVSGRSVTGNTQILPSQEINRLQRPSGGMICTGKPGEMKVDVRGELDNTGEWTHQYANPANTICSNDSLVRGPLEMLWFRDVDIIMPQRHGRGTAPLYHNGRMFVEGINTLRAVNAYNGRPLWDYTLNNVLEEYDQDHLMGVSGTQSNFCLSDDYVFIHNQEKCFKINAETGEKIAEYKTPNVSNGESGIWGYIAYKNGLLIGTTANENHVVKWRYLKGEMGSQYTESTSLFALDPETGETKWTDQAQNSIRHNAIAIGDNHVYLIDRPIADFDKIDYDKAKRRGNGAAQPTGDLIALDLKSGEIVWRKENNIYGTMLALSTDHDVLLMSYQSTRFQLDSEKGGRMAAFQASTGDRLWDIEADYGSRPLIVDQTIYAQPGAWDLLSGEKKEFHFTRSYGCGILAAAENLLVYRSATLGYRDLINDTETQNYGGIRPGCWINAIPAGGLILLPDAASGCTCSYLIQATIALQSQKGE